VCQAPSIGRRNRLMIVNPPFVYRSA
jgi:hypothetical protein